MKLNQQDGSIVWHEIIDAKYANDVQSCPIVMIEAKSTLIVGTYGEVFSFDRISGKVLWKNCLEGYGYFKKKGFFDFEYCCSHFGTSR